MAIRITDTEMTLTIGEKILATARFSKHAADGSGAWIVSTYETRLFTYNQAITALSLAERPANHPDGVRAPRCGSRRQQDAASRTETRCAARPRPARLSGDTHFGPMGWF
jgi:hypothetical protein